jgi:NAD+ kinase
METELQVGVLAYNRDLRVREAMETVAAWAARHGRIKLICADTIPAEWIPPEALSVNEQRLRSVHVLISIGGDGTFLSAARLVEALQTPILGVHTGKTGFLTDTPLEELGVALEGISREDYGIRPRLMMEVQRRSAGKNLAVETVLNEVLVRPVHPNRMVNLRVEVNGRFLTDYWADFLIIATPTGSTAYNLSAGGPILHPTTEAFIITAVNPPSLSVRPLVVPASARLLVRDNEGQGCSLTLDGREETLLEPGQDLLLTRSSSSTLFIQSSNYAFVDALKEKLGWCGNFRNTRGTDGC